MEESSKKHNHHNQPDLEKAGMDNEGKLTGIPSDHPETSEYPVPPKPNNPGVTHQGNMELVDNYNINDQAHSDSSKDDFVKTVSNFRHADATTPKSK